MEAERIGKPTKTKALSLFFVKGFRKGIEMREKALKDNCVAEYVYSPLFEKSLNSADYSPESRETVGDYGDLPRNVYLSDFLKKSSCCRL